jgi:ATP-dependent phosphofructokinase / diphosphate-dependent phosphofructokinase
MSESHIAVIAHSGGPTPVINASLLGAVEEARLHPEIRRVYGARFGIPGILNEDFVDLSAQPPELLLRVAESPASALGSSRYEVTQEDLARVLDVFRSYNIRYFFYTGGNGSMGTALHLKQAAERAHVPVRIIGIPKTIDNDLLRTDHTPGYASTARFFAHAVRDIAADNRSLPNQVEIVEVLGRNAGWIAAATTLAKTGVDQAPHLIYLPEMRLLLEKLLDDVSAVYRRLRRCVVVVCEGQLDENGEPFGADVRTGSRGALAQNLGHRLAQLIASRLNVRARSEKPGLLGRATSAYVSPIDWEEARLCGQAAVQSAIGGRSGVMVTLIRKDQPQYAVTAGEASLEDVAFTERLFPLDWISETEAGILPAFCAYAAPLVGAVEAHARLMNFPATHQKPAASG